jgi:hypothetical protein
MPASFFRGPHLTINVGNDSAPSDDSSVRFGQRAGPEEEPAVLSIKTPQSSLDLARLTRINRESPAFEQLGQVFRMDRRLPPRIYGIVKTKAGVLAPAPIEEVNVSIW